jgi:hypothetical protein
MDAATLGLIRDYGLPLIVLVISGFALYKRIIVLGSELDRKTELYEKELDYREARRLEEREARLASEQRVEKLTAAVEKFTPVLHDLVDAISGRSSASNG